MLPPEPPSIHFHRLKTLSISALLVASIQTSCTREADQSAADSSAGSPTVGNSAEPTTTPTSTDVPGAGTSATLTQEATASTSGPNGTTSASDENAESTTSSGSDGSKDTQDSNQTEETGTESLECEDGAARSCLETESGAAISFPGGSPQGSCKAGEQKCNAGTWGKCLGAVAPAEQDSCEPGNDDNCNGRPTDHCNCTSGETQPCGSDIGECAKGTLTCLPNGTWGESCEGEIKPTEEICDGKADENCDGKPDEVNCECINGATKACGVSDVGACKLGVQTCENGTWGSCQGAVGPSPERCDGKGIDEDCNGFSDIQDPKCECNHGTIERCTVPNKRGDCSLGSKQCQLGKWGRCNSRFLATQEVCGVLRDPKSSLFGPRTGDEDCDGKIDESDASNNFMPPDPLGEGQIFMIDKDGDGYGAIGEIGIVVRRYCKSNLNAVPANFVADTEGQANTDCGDCPGTGYDVHPGYRGDFVEVANACLQQVNWKYGAFDLNCNGVERKFNRNGICSVKTLGTSCTLPPEGVWERSSSSEVPACGETDTWINAADCTPQEIDGEISCHKKLAVVQKTQSCR